PPYPPLLRSRRTGGTGPRAGLRDVARPRRRPAHRARVARRVLARIAAAVALIERARIAVVGAHGPTRLLRIRRTRGTRARAGLRQVAHARRRAAHGAGGLEDIGGTGRSAPGAELRRVADPGRGAALGRRGLEGIGRAVIGDPVATPRPGA